MANLEGRDVSQEYMFYRMAYLAGSFVLQEDTSYMRTELLEGMSYRWTCLAGVHVL